jgi:hypothetical protein
MNEHLLNASNALRLAAIAIGLSALMMFVSSLLPEVRRFRRLRNFRRARRHHD